MAGPDRFGRADGEGVSSAAPTCGLAWDIFSFRKGSKIQRWRGTSGDGGTDKLAGCDIGSNFAERQVALASPRKRGRGNSSRRDRPVRAVRGAPAPRSRMSRSAAHRAASARSARRFPRNSHRCRHRAGPAPNRSWRSICAAGRGREARSPGRFRKRRDPPDPADSRFRFAGRPGSRALSRRMSSFHASSLRRKYSRWRSFMKGSSSDGR